MANKIKVLIVDDSALMRKLLRAILESDPMIEVVGAASDPFMARDQIKAKEPDVLTLDVEMPRMDGITFLTNLMRLRPMPVVMVSTLTEKGASVTLDALELGAFDFVSKPKVDVATSMEDVADELILKVKSAARARIRGGRSTPGIQRKPAAASVGFKTTDKVVAIGASTGGTEAIFDVVHQLPLDCPGVVVTQHIPAVFSKPFADRLDASCDLGVCEASDGQQIIPGHVYIAPGGKHLEVKRSGARYLCRVYAGEPVNRHCPSVDVLFDSVARVAGANAVGALLTGMGADGAKGLQAMQAAGARTIAQDEASSVVWGMPGSAVKLGAADDVVPLSRMAQAIVKGLGTGPRVGRA